MVESSRIASLQGQEILDSRGNPTLAVTVTLAGGSRATAAVPSGASTGRNEAVELRDGDPARYGGKGVRRAIAQVEGPIAAALRGHDVCGQAGIDRTMIALDGTPDKGRLGVNAMLVDAVDRDGAADVDLVHAAGDLAQRPVARQRHVEKLHQQRPVHAVMGDGDHDPASTSMATCWAWQTPTAPRDGSASGPSRGAAPASLSFAFGTVAWIRGAV